MSKADNVTIIKLTLLLLLLSPVIYSHSNESFSDQVFYNLFTEQKVGLFPKYFDIGQCR